MFQHILVPIDGSELSERAADSSVDLARRVGARVTAIVAEPRLPLQGMGTHGRGAFGELLFGSHSRNVLARSRLQVLR